MNYSRWFPPALKHIIQAHLNSIVAMRDDPLHREIYNTLQYDIYFVQLNYFNRIKCLFECNTDDVKNKSLTDFWKQLHKSSPKNTESFIRGLFLIEYNYDKALSERKESQSEVLNANDIIKFLEKLQKKYEVYDLGKILLDHPFDSVTDKPKELIENLLASTRSFQKKHQNPAVPTNSPQLTRKCHTTDALAIYFLKTIHLSLKTYFNKPMHHENSMLIKMIFGIDYNENDITDHIKEMKNLNKKDTELIMSLDDNFLKKRSYLQKLLKKTTDKTT